MTKYYPVYDLLGQVAMWVNASDPEDRHPENPEHAAMQAKWFDSVMKGREVAEIQVDDFGIPIDDEWVRMFQ